MSNIVTQLQHILGDENVSCEERDCILYAQDVFTKSLPALAVITPNTEEELAECVKAACTEGVAIVPRGGGMSYTSGYVPKETDSIIVDMTKFNHVIEINKTDMYVTVETGCTWEALYQALEGSGLRTPFWGTLSGKVATIGGGLSQNSIFWGSGKYGSTADSVLSLSVVTADGTIINTGSAARNHASPWFRNFGPDLTGLFLGDCGAFGFKTRATLKLIPVENSHRGLSFASESAEALLAFSSEVSRQQLAAEICGFDPFLQAQRLKRESIAKDVKALGGVMKSAGGLGKALKAGAKVALAGRSYMKDVKFSVHTLIQENSEPVAVAKEAAINAIAQEFGLREIENSIPTIMRANPFGPVNTMIGPEAERWVPVHAIMPHSKATTVYQAIEAEFSAHKESLEQYGIGFGYLFCTVGNGSTMIEPVFFWPDTLQELHRHAVEDAHLSKLKGFPENLAAREAVTSLRKRLCDVFEQHGCIHFQIGKSYPYLETLKAGSPELIKGIKAVLDPKGRINPGSLGLG